MTNIHLSEHVLLLYRIGLVLQHILGLYTDSIYIKKTQRLYIIIHILYSPSAKLILLIPLIVFSTSLPESKSYFLTLLH